MTLRRRAAAAVLLLAAVSGLCVHWAATEPQREAYPQPDELAADYDSYVGEEIRVAGRVTAAEPSALTVVADSDRGPVELRVTGTSAAVAPGGIVQVYGKLRPGRELAARNVVVVSDSGGAEWYKYGVSAVGAVGFLVVFLRQWRVDPATWTLEARDG